MAPTNNPAPSEVVPFWVQKLVTHTTLFRAKAVALASGDPQDAIVLVESYLRKHGKAMHAAVSPLHYSLPKIC